MFDLIEAADVTWRSCRGAGATILERDEGVVRAIIAIDWRGVRFSLTTLNPKRRPEDGDPFEDGPFRRFDGEWTLRAIRRRLSHRFPSGYDWFAP
jgi:ribosome-associated toxin RatA of RatAB toxin-antitoxin module